MSFPAAMFVMSGAFGLWRAGLISSSFFSAGVLAVVLVLLGGTTWATNGFWAPDGGYALISRIVLVAWIAVISGFLYMQEPLRGEGRLSGQLSRPREHLRDSS